MLEKIFYTISIIVILGGGIMAIGAGGSQIQSNTKDISSLKSQYSEIIIRLTRIEDFQHRGRDDGN
jgi:hypothetical protein